MAGWRAGRCFRLKRSCIRAGWGPSRWIAEIQWRRISLRLGVAAVYGMGVSGRVQVPPGAPGTSEPAPERVAGAGRLARPRNRSSFGRLLSADRDQFSAPDLVSSNGD